PGTALSERAAHHARNVDASPRAPSREHRTEHLRDAGDQDEREGDATDPQATSENDRHDDEYEADDPRGEGDPGDRHERSGRTSGDEPDTEDQRAGDREERGASRVVRGC